MNYLLRAAELVSILQVMLLDSIGSPLALLDISAAGICLQYLLYRLSSASF